MRDVNEILQDLRGWEQEYDQIPELLLDEAADLIEDLLDQVDTLQTRIRNSNNPDY